MRDSLCGRHIASVPLKPGEKINEIDPFATCLTASMRQAKGKSAFADDGIRQEDLRRRLRVQPVKKTIIFLIDASESMIEEEQIKLAKGAVLGLLTKAYQKRYRVGVITFSDYHAKVALYPTGSISRAKKALQAVASGGGTPLADGLQTALKVIRSEHIRHPNDMPQMILVTDGRPSITLKKGADLREEVLSIASRFSSENIPSIVLSTAEPGEILSEIASTLNAPLRKLSDVIVN